MPNLGLYAKAAVTAVVAAGAAYANALNDGPGVTGPEWISIALVFIANLAVITVAPYAPTWLRNYGKALFAFLTAVGGNLLANAFTDGRVSTSELITAIVAGAVASGLLAVFVSDAASSDPVSPATGKIVPISAEAKRSLVGAV